MKERGQSFNNHYIIKLKCEIYLCIKWSTILDFIGFHSILKKNKNEWVNKLNEQIEFKIFLQVDVHVLKLGGAAATLICIALLLRSDVISSGPVSTWIKRNNELQVLLTLTMTTNTNFPWVVKRNYVILWEVFWLYKNRLTSASNVSAFTWDKETKTHHYINSKKSWLLRYIYTKTHRYLLIKDENWK